MLRPSFDACKPTGVSLEAGERVVLVADRAGVADALARGLGARGVEVLRVDGEPSADELVASLGSFRSKGPIHGVFWLPALEIEPALWSLDESAWKELRRQRVKLAAFAVRELYADLEPAGSFFVAGTRMGGQHGYDPSGALSALGGAVAGFSKAVARERAAALVKCVDFERDARPDAVAEALVSETLRDPGVVEVGHRRGLRWTVGFDLRPAGESGMNFDENSVFVVTGGAGSITSAITADLATASGGSFWLLDLTPEPDAGNPDLDRLTTDREGLKRDLFERMKTRGERATPAVVEKELATWSAPSQPEAPYAPCRPRAVERTTGASTSETGSSVAPVVDEIRARHGSIDVLIHAAGLEISRALPDKSPEEFDLIWDVKCDGAHHLLRAVGEMQLGAMVAFSSIAGRFGNAGPDGLQLGQRLLVQGTVELPQARDPPRVVSPSTGRPGPTSAWRAAARSRKVMEAAGHRACCHPRWRIPSCVASSSLRRASSEMVAAGKPGALMRVPRRERRHDPSAFAPRHMPMLGKLVRVGQYSGLVVESTLDPARARAS